MRAGRLDRTIAIRRRSLTYSESGEPINGWADISVRPASISPVSGDERFAGDQWVAKEQVEFRVHYAEIVSDVGPLDQIIYPYSTGDSPAAVIPESRLYDIMAVHELGRREGLRIMAARRADVAP